MDTKPTSTTQRTVSTAPIGMPRSSLMDSVGSKEFVTRWLAQGIALLFTVVQVASAIVLIPMLLLGYHHAGMAGAELPLLVQAIQWLNWWGFSMLILLVNGLVFWFFYAIAKKSWVGIAFLPSLIYTFFTIIICVALIAPLLGAS